MEINIENNRLNLSVNNSSVEVVTGSSTAELDINPENNNLDLETGNSLVEFNLGMQTIYEKNHANLENLDYENSGHTGFQKAGDYALNSDIPDVSNLATKDEIPNVSGLATKEELPTKTSELQNDSGYITNDIETDFNIDGKLYLNTVKSGVGDATASRIVFGTPSKIYSYLSSNTSGAFAFTKGKGNITVYPNTGTYNCLMTDCNSDLGRSDRHWKDLYLGGSLKDGINTIPISNIATKDYVEETLGDIETLLGGI